jgi:hypothetical protein
VTRVPEAPLGEGEDLGGRHREYEGRTAILVVKAAAARLVLPSSVPLGRPRVSEALEHVLVGGLDCIAFDHDVEPPVPLVAAGGEDYVRVGAQV